METTDNPLLKNLRGLWWPQHSDWPVFCFSVNMSHDMAGSSFSIAMTACSFESLKPQQYSGMLDPRKSSAEKVETFLQSIRKSTDPLNF